ncbi:MAG: NAD(P)H-hydrate dehydratase [Campylobacterales bacterium]
MLPLFDQVNDLDRRAYDTYKMSEELLMEHAAIGLARQIDFLAVPRSRVLIVCGPGNNGADGLALARLLAGRYRVCVWLVASPRGSLGRRQLERLEALGISIVHEMVDEGWDVVVDALYGSGQNRPLSDGDAKVVAWLNRLSGLKIACDVPTGLMMDGTIQGEVFRADVTVTMGAAKTALYSDSAKEVVGKIVVAGLGLPEDAYCGYTPMALLEEEDLKLPLRHACASHKGSYGHVAVMAGEKPGAALLAANAALSFGAGLVTVVSSTPPQALGMELMHHSDIPERATAIAVGMGLGEIDEKMVRKLSCDPRPMVVDADLFASPSIGLLLARQAPTILTPHAKEFGRMAGLEADEVQRRRFAVAREFGLTHPGVILILKGANPLIVHGEKLRVVACGSVALAKGGSGDVLAGMVAALLAQGWEPFEAASQAVLAHAIASRRVGVNNYALTPLALIEEIKKL